jgi:hypothetical protein
VIWDKTETNLSMFTMFRDVCSRAATSTTTTPTKVAQKGRQRT